MCWDSGWKTGSINKQVEDEQAKRGTDWNFKLTAVYTIGILDFLFDEQKQENNQQVIHHVQLKNQDNRLFYEKLTFIYLTLPNFNKTEHELETLQDKWLFLFRLLHELQEIPKRLQEKILIKAFEIANIARLEPEQRKAYEDSRDYIFSYCRDYYIRVY